MWAFTLEHDTMNKIVIVIFFLTNGELKNMNWNALKDKHMVFEYIFFYILVLSTS